MAFGDNDNGQSSFQKKMYEGNWKCGSCGGPITKLPFQPNPDPERQKTLKCIDCWKKSRPPRDRF